MLATGRRLSEDPAAAAAGLILRLGIAILALAVPCGAVISRRLLFVLMPVGAALMLIGGLLQPGERGRLVVRVLPPPPRGHRPDPEPDLGHGDAGIANGSIAHGSPCYGARLLRAFHTVWRNALTGNQEIRMFRRFREIFPCGILTTCWARWEICDVRE